MTLRQLERFAKAANERLKKINGSGDEARAGRGTPRV
jgi:hypothetical protein